MTESNESFKCVESMNDWLDLRVIIHEWPEATESIILHQIKPNLPE